MHTVKFPSVLDSNWGIYICFINKQAEPYDPTDYTNSVEFFAAMVEAGYKIFPDATQTASPLHWISWDGSNGFIGINEANADPHEITTFQFDPDAGFTDTVRPL
jgi:hypothetical protein